MIERMEAPPFPCPVCQEYEPTRQVARETSAAGEVGVQRCTRCGLHFTWPRLSEPQGMYLAATEAAWQAKYGAIDRGERLHDRHQNYLQEVAVLGHYVPQGRVLDVGCNAGWLLGYLQREGVYTLEGVEPSEALAAIARRRLGLPIFNGYLDALRDRDEAYDAIVATDVIEHVLPEAIHAFVAALAARLRPGGYAFIKTPNAHFTALKARIAARLPGGLRRWLIRSADMWDAKEHVIHWDARSLRRVFERHGLETVRVFVPLMVETDNSPTGARLARRLIYAASQTVSDGRRIPFFAQDIFLIAQKTHAGRGTPSPY